MTHNLNSLHPTPWAEALTGMEIQPEHYDVVALTHHTPVTDPEQAQHGTVRVIFAFGKTCPTDDVLGAALDAVAALHAHLKERHTLRLDYVPGENGTDAALDEYPPEQEGPNTDE